MRKVALIVEGHGDQHAIPTLVTKTAQVFGVTAFAAHPIRAGGLLRLLRPGELEKYAEMAGSRPDADAIVLVVDIDDGCAAEMSRLLSERLAPIAERFGKDFGICLCVREYESWLLEEVEYIRENCPDYEWAEGFECQNPENIRGRKSY